MVRLTGARRPVKLALDIMDALDKPSAEFRMSGMETTLNSRLAMIHLPDPDGRELRLGSLWIRQPAVLVFLRHYG